MSAMRIYGGPRRYVQGPGALKELKPTVEGFGHRPLLLADGLVRSVLEEALGRGFDALEVVTFGGECTAVEIERVARVGRSAACDVVVGAGGGKALDVAKAVASDLGSEVVIVPTVASNDAPTSRLSVVYGDAHAIEGVRLAAFNPAVVIVDTSVIVRAPRRFFVAGIGDALSKRFEAEQCRLADGLNFFGGRPTLLVKALAEACYRTLFDEAPAALAALDRGVPDEFFERTVEATVLLSGLAFENGGLSIAHALTRGLSAVPQLAGALHGEQVAYGLIVQMVAERRPPAELAELRGFLARVGLASCLKDLARGPLDVRAASEQIVARTLCDASHHLKHFARPVDAALLHAAIADTEALAAGQLATP